MTVYADGALITPAHSFVAGEGIPLSLYHIGFRYGLYTTASYSMDDDISSTTIAEDTGNYPTALPLVYGALMSNTVAKFGTTSMHLPSMGSKVVFDPALTVSAGANFTMEFWIYPTAVVSNVLLSTASDTLLGQVGNLLYWGSTGNEGTQGLTQNVWQHIAVSRYGNILRMFKNGVKILELVYSDGITIYGIGNTTTGTSYAYYDSFGFSDSYAHYKDEFQTPILPFFAVPSTTGTVLNSVGFQFVVGEATGSLLTPAEYDPHWRNTVLLVKGGGAHGTYDVIEHKNRRVRNIGSAMCSNVQTKFNDTSIYFPGTAGLQVAHSCELSFMYDDFTIELWYYPTNLSVLRTLVGMRGTFSDPGWQLYTNTTGKLVFQFRVGVTTVTLTSSVALTLNQWSFLTVTLTENTYRLFVNGVMVASSVTALRPDAIPVWYAGSYTAVPLSIGYLIDKTDNTSYEYGAKGYIEELRITNGVSRYPSDDTFGVPTGGFIASSSGADGDPYWTETKALVHFDESEGTVYNIRDARGHTVSLYGNTAVVSDSYPPYATSRCGRMMRSPYGETGVTLNYTTEFDLSSGDFTLELFADIGSARHYKASAIAMISADRLTLSNTRGWSIGTVGDGYLPSETDAPSGTVQWIQYDGNGVSDIAIGPMDCLVVGRWHHLAVVRSGTQIQVFVDGKGGTPTTINRIPYNLAQGIEVGRVAEWLTSANTSAFSIADSVRITRAARYKGDFIPLAGKMPEFLYTFGYALATETTSLIPGSPRAAATVPGATVGHDYKLEIPKVVAPVVAFNEALFSPASAVGGEGGRGDVLFIEGFHFRQTYRKQHNLYFADEATAQGVVGAYDELGVSSAVKVTLGNVTIAETPSFTATVDPAAKLYASTSDSVTLPEQYGIAVRVGLYETINLSSLLSLARHVSQRDSAYLHGDTDTLFTFDIDTVEALGFASESVYGKGGSLSESFTVGGTTVAVRQVPVSIASVIELSDAGVGTVYLQVSMDDTLAMNTVLTPAQTLEALIADAVHFEAYMSSPTYTTWVMNTRSTAVSQYDGYQFNSFAKVGERYLGASDNGLFWLDGDTDAGSPVLTTVQPGVVQPHANKLARVLYAYLGMRGEGAFAFTVTDEAGGSYVYKLDAESMKTGRVTFGKGMRTRYFTFKIESDGQDYDLDNIEFVTAEMSRKVQR